MIRPHPHSRLSRSVKSEPHRSEAGFTLIEGMVVVIIIGVLMAILAPSWVAFNNRQRLNTANDQVLQAIRAAQAEAKRTHSNRQVRFDNNNDSPRYAILPAPFGGAVTNWQSLGGGDVKPGTLRLTTSGGNFIAFNADGIVATQAQVAGNPTVGEDQPFRITIALKNSLNTKRCNKVRTLLGAVTQASNAQCP